jgi:outer membrane protein assembly factor BamB
MMSVGARALALAGLVALAGGCFWQGPGATPDRDGHNAFEAAVTPSTVGGLALAWEAPTDGGAVRGPVTSTAGVHVVDQQGAYGFDRSGDRLWAVASPEPRAFHEAYVAGADTVHLGRWDRAATEATDPSAGDETLRLDAATGDPVAEPLAGVAIGERGDRLLRWSVDFARLGRGGQFPFWMTGLGLDGTTCCPYWLGLTSAGPDTTPPEPPGATVGTSHLFTAGDGPLSSTDPSQVGNGLRGYAIDAPVACFGNYLCPSWVTALDGSTATRPALAEGGEVAYVGTDAGTVYAVDGATGATLWARPVGAAVVDTPARAGGSLYVPTAGQGLVVLDAAAGARQWSTAAATLVGQPAVAGGVVFTAATGGTLAAHDAGGCGAAACAPLWSAQAGAEVSGGPAVDGGIVYVGTADARLLAYRLG